MKQALIYINPWEDVEISLHLKRLFLLPSIFSQPPSYSMFSSFIYLENVICFMSTHMYDTSICVT